MTNKFKKGDTVIAISGSSKGKQGKILKFDENRVLVSGLNLGKFHIKPKQGAPGSIIEKERPIHISNISHVENNQPIKIKFVIDDGEGKSFTRKYRVSRKSNQKI